MMFRLAGLVNCSSDPQAGDAGDMPCPARGPGSLRGIRYPGTRRAASSFAIRGLAGVMREAAGLAAALLARTPDISKMETRLGVPRISNFALAADSPAWQTTHA